MQDRGPWATAFPHDRADRWRALAPAALLVAVASLGVYRSATMDQSSWRGASFGMFATYDNAVSRTVVVTVGKSDGVVRVRLPDDLEDDADRLSVVPTDAAAQHLARAALAVAPADVTRVKVEVWRLVLADDDDLTVRLDTLATGTARR